MKKSVWTFWPQKTRPQHSLITVGPSHSMTCTTSHTSTVPLQKHKSSHSNTPVTTYRKWKSLEKVVLQGNWGCTKHHQTCEDHGNWGNLHGKKCVATWRLVDFSREWMCYAQFTFWIQRQLIMNCRLDQVFRPEDVDVQSELEGLEPVPDSDQSIYC